MFSTFIYLLSYVFFNLFIYQQSFHYLINNYGRREWIGRWYSVIGDWLEVSKKAEWKRRSARRFNLLWHAPSVSCLCHKNRKFCYVVSLWQFRTLIRLRLQQIQSFDKKTRQSCAAKVEGVSYNWYHRNHCETSRRVVRCAHVCVDRW